MVLARLVVVGVMLTGLGQSPVLGLSRPAVSPPSTSPGYRVVIRAEPTDRPSRVGPPLTARLGVQTAAIGMNVTYIGDWTPEAQAAFQHAVDIWATQLVSTVPVEINATWEPLAPGVLGSAGAGTLHPDFPNAPVAGTLYPAAVANSLAGSDLEPGVADVYASFNSDFPAWYFGTDGNTPSGKYDFVSVVMHEIGHGVGVFGSMEVVGDEGEWGWDTGYPTIYDRFAVNGAGDRLLDTGLFPNPSTELKSELESDDVFFDGSNAVAAAGGVNPRLYAPGSWRSGSSYSHLDEATYPAGNANALMTPFLSGAESNHDPGPITLGLLQDEGWIVNVGPFSTATPTPTATATDVYTPTSTPTPTATPTDTSTPTTTPTSVASDTPTSTPTATATSTATPTSVATDTPTGTPTPTVAPSETPTGTPTSTVTLTAASTPTVTPTGTPTPTVSATSTSTATATSTASPTPTATVTATASPTITATPTLCPDTTLLQYAASLWRDPDGLAGYNLMYDTNEDGVINVIDLEILASALGRCL